MSDTTATEDDTPGPPPKPSTPPKTPLTAFDLDVLRHLAGEDVEGMTLNRSRQKAIQALVRGGYVTASVKMSGVTYTLTDSGLKALRAVKPQLPFETAHYWAKWKYRSEWEVVFVAPHPRDDDSQVALVTGVEGFQAVDEFEWGPQVIKPEGL